MAATPRSGPRQPGAVRPLAINRRARHDYELLETLEAGLVLTGTEVKACRLGRVQLRDAFVELRDGEAWLVGVHVSPYSHGNRENHLPDRPRKLLLHRREIDRLLGRVQVKGLTVIPLSLYLRGNRIKVELAVAQGRKSHDKREAERRREAEAEAREAIREHRR
ncbi:MAG: SsrA-binding protein [Acidobacteria bacterium ADurb.Bin051]|jgi:SsrA-binding protein|nr:MAG: SsrA-binding protein [Acidobacteria bacterium ADurb.Bin051]